MSIELSHPPRGTTIGFDRLAKMLDAARLPDTSFPPFNIEQRDDGRYRVTLAVAGYAPDEIVVTFKPGELVIRGTKADRPGPESRYLHRGIALRNFLRRFILEEHIQVTAAEHDNGLLHIELEREIPEEKKIRTIPIATVPASIATADPA